MEADAGEYPHRLYRQRQSYAFRSPDDGKLLAEESDHRWQSSRYATQDRWKLPLPDLRWLVPARHDPHRHVTPAATSPPGGLFHIASPVYNRLSQWTRVISLSCFMVFRPPGWLS